MSMSQEKWEYIKKQAQEQSTRFVRCGGIVYEVYYEFLRSESGWARPLWSVDEVSIKDIPDFKNEAEVAP